MNNKDFKINLSYSEKMKELLAISQAIANQMKELVEPIYPVISELQSQMRDIMTRIPKLPDVSKSLSVAFQPLVDSIKSARDNPDSMLSWYEYYKILGKCFWVFPYGITTEELRLITSEDISESKFDEYMINHFSEEIINQMRDDTLSLLPEKHIVIYKQSVNSFFVNGYALCNLGLISIIDDLTSFFLEDKGCTARYGMFDPIVDILESMDISEFKQNHLVLIMINENIKRLYKKYPFDKEIVIDSNKDINRQTSMHGKYYSDKRESSLMLLNTIYYLKIIIKEFECYKNKIIYKRNQKLFVLD